MTERRQVQAQQLLEHDLAARLTDRQSRALTERGDRGRVVVDPLELERHRPRMQGGGRHLGAAGHLDRPAERERVADRGEPVGALDEERAALRVKAGQATLDAPVLVPVEEVQVEHLLTGGHQAHVERLPAHDADRAEGKLERRTAHHVGFVVTDSRPQSSRSHLPPGWRPIRFFCTSFLRACLPSHCTSSAHALQDHRLSESRRVRLRGAENDRDQDPDVRRAPARSGARAGKLAPSAPAEVVQPRCVPGPVRGSRGGSGALRAWCARGLNRPIGAGPVGSRERRGTPSRYAVTWTVGPVARRR